VGLRYETWILAILLVISLFFHQLSLDSFYWSGFPLLYNLLFGFLLVTFSAFVFERLLAKRESIQFSLLAAVGIMLIGGILVGLNLRPRGPIFDDIGTPHFVLGFPLRLFVYSYNQLGSVSVSQVCWGNIWVNLMTAIVSLCCTGMVIERIVAKTHKKCTIVPPVKAVAAQDTVKDKSKPKDAEK